MAGAVSSVGAGGAKSRGGPSGVISDATCKEVGKINIKCYNKHSEEYIGLVSVDARLYDENGVKDCLYSYQEVRDRCTGAYGISKDDLGFYYEYKILSTTWSLWVPDKSKWGN